MSFLGRGADAAFRTMKPRAKHRALICSRCQHNITPLTSEDAAMDGKEDE